MDKKLKNIIEERFESKKQQRYFYAKASDKNLSPKERKKWSKWAKEFSSDTDFDKLPEKKEVDEIVDTKGNISTSNKPPYLGAKYITQDKTSDEVVKAGAGSMGTHGVHGTHTSLRYWAESDMSKSLGYKETLGDDADFDDAKKHFKKDLGLPEKETEDRMGQMGYDENLPEDQVRLVENPKKSLEEFIESILSKKNQNNDIVKNSNIELKEVNPIIKRQIKSLKDSLKSHDLSFNDIKEYLQDDE